MSCSLHPQKVVTNTRTFSSLSFLHQGQKIFLGLCEGVRWQCQPCTLLYLQSWEDGEMQHVWLQQGCLCGQKFFFSLTSFVTSSETAPRCHSRPHSAKHPSCQLAAIKTWFGRLLASKWEKVVGGQDQCATAKLLVDLFYGVAVPCFPLLCPVVKDSFLPRLCTICSFHCYKKKYIFEGIKGPKWMNLC